MVKSFSQSDRNILLSVELSLHLNKKDPCQQHNHEADFVDQCKINSFVMDTVGGAVAAGWEVYSVHRNIKGVKWTSNLTALEAAEVNTSPSNTVIMLGPIGRRPTVTPYVRMR